MKDLLKKGAKGVAGIGNSAVKTAVSAIIGEIIKDIANESGATDIAKDKMMEAGLKIFGQMEMDPQKIQRDVIKTMLKKEFNL